MELSALLPPLQIPAGGVCAWSDELLLPNVRSASRLPQNPKSVIVCSFPYYAGRPRGRNLSLYAMLPDYHAVVLELLWKLAAALATEFPGAAFAPFCDASPVDEVEAGMRAGVGVRGRNGLLITQAYGSLVFLGELVTDLALPASDFRRLCPNCGACVRACPTNALSRREFAREACLSHITQKKGALTEAESRRIAENGLVWGCDGCLLACPFNRLPRPTPIEAFLEDVEPVLTLENLGRLMENRAFAWRGRAVLERNLALLAPKE